MLLGSFWVLGPGLLVYAVTNIFGCCDDLAIKRFEVDSYNELERQGVIRSIDRIIPKAATEIKLEYAPGDLTGGSSLRFRCHVDKLSMRDFILKWNGSWQLESTMVNDSRDYSFAVMETPQWCGEFWQGEQFPSRGMYWSYNKIYKNNGGVRCYYDVEREVYYYEYFSN